MKEMTETYSHLYGGCKYYISTLFVYYDKNNGNFHKKAFLDKHHIEQINKQIIIII